MLLNIAVEAYTAKILTLLDGFKWPGGVMDCIQYSDAVRWVAGRASVLYKTEWWVLAWLSA